MASYSILATVNGKTAQATGDASGTYTYEDILPSGSSTFNFQNIDNPVVVFIKTDRPGCTFTLPGGSPVPCYPVGIASNLDGMSISSVTVNNPGGEGEITIVAADYQP